MAEADEPKFSILKKAASSPPDAPEDDVRAAAAEEPVNQTKEGDVDSLAADMKATVVEDNQVDPCLVSAVNNPRDYTVVYKVEAALDRFVKEPGALKLDFPPMSSYHRLLVHRMAQHYKLDHTFDSNKKAVILEKNAKSAIPEIKVTSLKEEKPAAAEPAFRIMRRVRTEEEKIEQMAVRREASGEMDLTLEQREEAYRNARARIFSESPTSSPTASGSQQAGAVPAGSVPPGSPAGTAPGMPAGTPAGKGGDKKPQGKNSEKKKEEKSKAETRKRSPREYQRPPRLSPKNQKQDKQQDSEFMGWASEPVFEHGQPRGVTVVDPDDDPRWSRNAPLWRGPSGGISTQPTGMGMMNMGMMNMGMMGMGGGPPSGGTAPPFPGADYSQYAGGPQMRSPYASTIWQQQPGQGQGWQQNSGWMDRAVPRDGSTTPPPGSSAASGPPRGSTPSPPPQFFAMYGQNMPMQGGMGRQSPGMQGQQQGQQGRPQGMMPQQPGQGMRQPMPLRTASAPVWGSAYEHPQQPNGAFDRQGQRQPTGGENGEGRADNTVGGSVGFEGAPFGGEVGAVDGVGGDKQQQLRGAPGAGKQQQAPQRGMMAGPPGGRGMPHPQHMHQQMRGFYTADFRGDYYQPYAPPGGGVPGPVGVQGIGGPPIDSPEAGLNNGAVAARR